MVLIRGNAFTILYTSSLMDIHKDVSHILDNYTSKFFFFLTCFIIVYRFVEKLDLKKKKRNRKHL